MWGVIIRPLCWTHLLIESLFVQMIVVLVFRIIVDPYSRQVGALKYALAGIIMFEIVHVVCRSKRGHTLIDTSTNEESHIPY